MKSTVLPPYITFTMDRDGSTKLVLHAVAFTEQRDLQILINMLMKMKPFLEQKEPG
jgi:hypothetical protein